MTQSVMRYSEDTLLERGGRILVVDYEAESKRLAVPAL